MKKILFTSVLIAAFVTVISCTKTEQTQVVEALPEVGACIADVVMATQGTEDPTAIASACGAAVSDVYAVVTELLEKAPLPVAVDAAPVPTLSPDSRAHLQRIATHAHTLLSDASLVPGK